MSTSNEAKLTRAQIKAIEDVLKRGERVELIPVRDGVKIIKIIRRNLRQGELE